MSAVDARPAAPPTAAPAGLAAAIQGHPLVAYFLIAFAGTWLLFVPILLSPRGFNLVPLPDAVGFFLFVLSTYAGPFLSACIVTRAVTGAAGLRAWFKRMVQWRAGLGWYLLVLLGYPILFGVTAITALGAPALKAAGQNWPSFSVAFLVAIPTGFLLPTLGEEAGWRGFALPRLQQLHGPLVGSLILGVLHALWHLPAYFVKGAINETGVFDPVAFAGNSLAIIASTFVWTWLFNHTDGSIFFATYVHATSNALSGALVPALNITTPDPWFTFKVMGTAALLLILVTRARLGYRAAPPSPA